MARDIRKMLETLDSVASVAEARRRQQIIIEYVDDLQAKIAELEKKLAESERAYKKILHDPWYHPMS